jgi:hypothetical protein
VRLGQSDNIHGGDVLAGEGVGSVRDQETGLALLLVDHVRNGSKSTNLADSTISSDDALQAQISIRISRDLYPKTYFERLCLRSGSHGGGCSAVVVGMFRKESWLTMNEVVVEVSAMMSWKKGAAAASGLRSFLNTWQLAVRDDKVKFLDAKSRLSLK